MVCLLKGLKESMVVLLGLNEEKNGRVIEGVTEFQESVWHARYSQQYLVFCRTASVLYVLLGERTGKDWIVLFPELRGETNALHAMFYFQT